MARPQDLVEAKECSDADALLTRWSRDFRLPLIRFFQKRSPPGTEPDDLVQEVFVRLARRADLASIERIEGYLFQTAASVLADWFRRDARQLEIVESFEETSHGEVVLTPERVLMGKQAIQQLIQALYALPERTRHIFVLYHFENLRQTEIAARFGMSVSTVEKHMGRANKQLLKRLGRES